MESYLAALPPIAPDDAGINRPLLPRLAWTPPILAILLLNPLNSDPRGYGGALILRISRMLSSTLPKFQRVAVRRALQSLLATLPAEVFGARCVRPAQRYIEHLVTTGKLGAARLEVGMY
jgi:hypothetical protein